MFAIQIVKELGSVRLFPKKQTSIIDITEIVYRPVVERAVIYPSRFMMTHEYVSESGAKRQAHPKTFYLFIELTIELEYGVKYR